MFHPAVVRNAPWSVSKLGKITSCPRAFWHNYKQKDRSESTMESRVGNVVHNVQEHSLLGAEGTAEDKLIQESLKEELSGPEYDIALAKLEGVKAFAKRAEAFEKARGVVTKEVEGRFAITREFKSCDYESKEAFVRGRLDYMAITMTRTAMVVDHKTGKKKASVDDHATQLQIYAIFVLAKYPEIEWVKSGIHYVGDPDLVWMPVFSAAEIKKKLHPWLVGVLNRQANNLVQVEADVAHAKPSALCKWCSYSKEKCPEGKAEVERRAEIDRAKAAV